MPPPSTKQTDRVPHCHDQHSAQPGPAPTQTGFAQPPGLGHRVWDFGLQSAWHWLDKLLPAIPGAGATKLPEQPETCAGKDCTGSTPSRLSASRPSLDFLEEQSREHFHIHVSPSIAQSRRRQPLAGSIVILALDSNQATQDIPPWHTLFESLHREGDLLFRERRQAWLENDLHPSSLDSKQWKESGDKIDAATYRRLRQQARRLMKPLLESMKTAPVDGLPGADTFWSQTYDQQVEFIEREHRRIDVAPPHMISASLDTKTYQKRMNEFAQANADFNSEHLRLVDLRCTALFKEILPGAGEAGANRIVTMDAELLKRIDTRILAPHQVIIVASRQSPVNVRWSTVDKHPVTIRYLKELVAAQNGRVSISPLLSKRPDQSLAGTVVLLADEQHEHFDLLWQASHLANELLRPDDKVLVERSDGHALDFYDCQSRPENCIAIDDSISRAKLEPYSDACKRTFIEFCHLARADGLPDIPLQQNLQGISIHQLNKVRYQLLSLMGIVHLSPATLNQAHAMMKAWEDWEYELMATNEARESVMASRLKSHLFEDGICFSRLGASHVWRFEKNLPEQLPLIIIWPDAPDAELWHKNRQILEQRAAGEKG